MCVAITSTVFAASRKGMVRTYHYTSWGVTVNTTDYYFYNVTAASKFADGLAYSNTTNYVVFFATTALGKYNAVLATILGGMFLIDSNQRSSYAQNIRNQAYKTGACRYEIVHIYTRGGQVISSAVYNFNKKTINIPKGNLVTAIAW